MQRYEKLYIITRQDLSPGLQAAQVAHAAFQFAHEHRPLTASWLEESNFLIILAVENETELKALGTEAEARSLPVTWFTEPDIDDQLTAIAIAPSPATVELCAELPLALRDYRRTIPGEVPAVKVGTDLVVVDLRGFPIAGASPLRGESGT